MTNRDNPSGFIPVGRLDGSDIPVRRFRVDSSNDTAIYVHDLVATEADGAVEVADNDEGDSLLGAVTAVYDTNGVPCGAPNSLVSTRYLTAETAGWVDVALALPDSVFRCQVASAKAPAKEDVFNASDHSVGTPNAASATSGAELDGDFSASNQFKVIGKVDEPGNDWGEHVDVLVVASESFWNAGTDGV